MCEGQCVIVLKATVDLQDRFIVIYPWAGDLTTRCLSLLIN